MSAFTISSVTLFAAIIGGAVAGGVGLIVIVVVITVIVCICQRSVMIIDTRSKVTRSTGFAWLHNSGRVGVGGLCQPI